MGKRSAEEDVQEVVRCSKCIWHSNRTGMCHVWFKTTDYNGYCYRGEEKTNEVHNHIARRK